MITKEIFFERYAKAIPLFNEFEKLSEKYEATIGDAAQYVDGSLIGVEDSESLGLKQNVKLKSASLIGYIIGFIIGLIVFCFVGGDWKGGKIIKASIIGIIVGIVVSKIAIKLLLDKIMTKEVEKLDNHLDKLNPIVNEAVDVCDNIYKTMIDVPLMYCYPFALKTFFELFKADRADDTRAAIEIYEKSSGPKGLDSEVAEVLKKKMMNTIS